MPIIFHAAPFSRTTHGLAGKTSGKNIHLIYTFPVDREDVTMVLNMWIMRFHNAHSIMVDFRIPC